MCGLFVVPTGFVMSLSEVCPGFVLGPFWVCTGSVLSLFSVPVWSNQVLSLVRSGLVVGSLQGPLGSF